jgi:hypothetical protein
MSFLRRPDTDKKEYMDNLVSSLAEAIMPASPGTTKDDAINEFHIHFKRHPAEKELKHLAGQAASGPEPDRRTENTIRSGMQEYINLSKRSSSSQEKQPRKTSAVRPKESFQSSTTTA